VGEIFRTVKNSPGSHPASYKTDSESFPGVKRPGRGVGYSPPSTAEIKERVQLYLHSPSGPSWPLCKPNFTFFAFHFSKSACAEEFLPLFAGTKGSVSMFRRHNYCCSRSQWRSGLRRGSAAARLLGLRVRIPPGAWIFVCCECCVFVR
jgi:hypothetical protein